MTTGAPKAEFYLQTALEAVRQRADWQMMLDELPVPIYTTDADGAITYWNRECVVFTGRQPELGRDRWCVTWQLYTTTGERLPHETCPMATAITKKCEVRGEVAIALRPDGSRRAFTPYPTPLFDNAGNLTGAVNMLIDVTNQQASVLSEQAARCKRLAKAVTDKPTLQILSRMAEGYAATAAALKASSEVTAKA